MRQEYICILSTGLGLFLDVCFGISLILQHFVFNKMLFLEIVIVEKTRQSKSGMILASEKPLWKFRMPIM